MVSGFGGERRVQEDDAEVFCGAGAFSDIQIVSPTFQELAAGHRERAVSDSSVQSETQNPPNSMCHFISFGTSSCFRISDS